MDRVISDTELKIWKVAEITFSFNNNDLEINFGKGNNTSFDCSVVSATTLKSTVNKLYWPSQFLAGKTNMIDSYNSITSVGTYTLCKHRKLVR